MKIQVQERTAIMTYLEAVNDNDTELEHQMAIMLSFNLQKMEVELDVNCHCGESASSLDDVLLMDTKHRKLYKSMIKEMQPK